MPKLTVLMPVYNAELFVKDAMASILKQTVTDFEFLIIDDGCTDSTFEIINSFKDNRIRILSNRKNLGLIRSLNIGIEEAKGEYISRMDADDIAHPKRLEYIAKCFDENPDIMVCSTWFNTTLEDKPLQSRKYNSDEIKTLFFFDCAISAASYRRSFFQSKNIRYSEEFPHAEDYELWTRLLFYGKFAIIPKCLLKITWHENQVSRKFQLIQQSSMEKALIILLSKIGINPTSEEIRTHFQIAHDLFPNNTEFIEKAEAWLQKLTYHNSVSQTIPADSFRKIVSKEWFGILTHLSSKKVYTLPYFKKSSLSDKKNIPMILLLKYYYKNLGLKS